MRADKISNQMAGTDPKRPFNLALVKSPQEVIRIRYSKERQLILSNEIVLRLMKFPNWTPMTPKVGQYWTPINSQYNSSRVPVVFWGSFGVVFRDRLVAISKS